MRPVERYSIGYNIARFWVRSTFKLVFYRSWKIRGLEKIDMTKPHIFAANHQNALMDALHLLVMLKAQPIFLARADMFKNKTLAKVLNWMKIMPVYRIRDGYESLQKNEEVFEQCAKVLAKGRSMIIFPEGNHGDQRNLRALKKGLARVAFGAEEARNFELGLEIVPVGLDYSHYEKFRAHVTISVGEPIPVAQFKDIYQSDAQKGLKALNEEIRRKIFPHMIHIPWGNIYDGVMGVRTLFGARFAAHNSLPYNTTFNRFDADKALISHIETALDKTPEKMEEICKKTATYSKILQRSKLREHIPANAPYGFFRIAKDLFLLLLGFPFFLYGLINNFHIFFVPEKLSKTLIKDRQFRSSVAYVLSFVAMVPIFFTLQTLIIHWVFEPWWAPWVYLLSLMPLGILAIQYSFLFKKTRARIGYSRQLRKQDPRLMKLLGLRTSLIEELDKLLLD